jgi:hypothetical protein
MSSRAPAAHLIRNPWRDTLGDGLVLDHLTTAAITAQEQLEQWQVDQDRESFAAVILDPTLSLTTGDRIRDFVIAIILIGPNAEDYLPNAAANADAHSRHFRSSSELVEVDNYLLADGESALGGSALYREAISGGSGSSVKMDDELVMIMLMRFVDRISRARENWLQAQLSSGSRAWFSSDDRPDPQYAEVCDLVRMLTR